MTAYQVTLFCANGLYKPISTIIKAETDTPQKDILTKGTTKICQKRMWKSADLKKFGYTKAKIRVYDKAEIDKQNAERYERIKQEKYASGEWKKPRGAK